MTDTKPDSSTRSSSDNSKPHEQRRYSKNHFERYAEARLKLDYAILRFPKTDVAFKTQDQDPRVWFTAKHIPEREQVALHLRMPVKDERNELTDFLDVDIYFPKEQVAEIVKILAQPAKNEQVMKLQFMMLTRQDLEHALHDYFAARSSRQGSVRARISRHVKARTGDCSERER